MPIARPRNPDLKWSFELPQRLRLAIADAIVLYSCIESCCIEIIWEIEQADLPRKQELAKNWGEQNFKLLRKAVESLPGVKTDRIWPALKELGKERNLIGHGVWMWTNEKRPLYSVDVDCGLFDGPRSFQPVPRLMPIVIAIISAAAVALHQIKRPEGSGISGPFAFLEGAITDISF